MKAAKPHIITRAQWGAEVVDVPTYDARTDEDLAKIYDRISVHHEARLASESMTELEGKARMREIQGHHFANGWSDIGYHYVIDPRGRIYSGRSLFSPGAHVERGNTGNAGVCLMGNFEKQWPTAEQQASLAALLAHLCSALEISPNNILGHRDQNSTACPGRKLYDLMTGLRNNVRAKLKE